MMDWRNIEYLSLGNAKQQKVYTILKETNILSLLNEYDPIVVGTIPIGIDIAESDIDIICNVSGFNKFRETIIFYFPLYHLFSEYSKEEAYIASFSYSDMQIEIYAKDEPTVKQNGYRHMLIEHRILNIAGEEFKQEIIKLKEQGYKTEPAFGKLLNLTDPYTDLLILEKFSDKQLHAFLRSFIS